MIETAILLAAGEGSRLRSAAQLKPLCSVAGRSLLEHAVGGLADAGLKRVVVVIGYCADQIAAHIEAHSWPIAVDTVRTDDYRKPNGTSVLAAEPLVGNEEALLAMCDHLVDRISIGASPRREHRVAPGLASTAASTAAGSTSKTSPACAPWASRSWTSARASPPTTVSTPAYSPSGLRCSRPCVAWNSRPSPTACAPSLPREQHSPSIPASSAGSTSTTRRRSNWPNAGRPKPDCQQP